MRFCRIAAVYVMCLGVWAGSGYTVQQIKQFITSAIQLKNPDKEVAETLRKMKLSERLDLDTVEALQGQGAGPKTVAVLKELATESASLPEARRPLPSPFMFLRRRPRPKSRRSCWTRCGTTPSTIRKAARFHLPGADPPLCRHHRAGKRGGCGCHHGAAQLFQPEGRLQAGFAER
jgi:hypothetical protein